MNNAFQVNNHLLILNNQTELQQAVSTILPNARVLAASDYDSALKLMLTYKISVLICNIESDYPAALAFFAQLKQQHPQTVSIVLADHADSGDIVGLIKQAHIYRYMFKPLKMRLMARYLETALKRHHELCLASNSSTHDAMEEIKPLATARFASSALATVNADNVLVEQTKSAGVKNMQRLYRRFILRQGYS